MYERGTCSSKGFDQWGGVQRTAWRTAQKMAAGTLLEGTNLLKDQKPE
jgi:hypothetical protein